METLKGIKYINSGGRRYVRIDLDMYGGNQALEDFLDLIEIEARKDEPVYPFEEVMKAEFERRGLKYDV
jgi:hypothetical protein